MAQLVEHYSANTEATALNPIEAPENLFFGGGGGLNLQLLKLRRQLQLSHLHFICVSTVHIIFIL